MPYRYADEFPEASRCRIRCEEILAGRDFEREKQEAPYYSDVEDILRTYILRVFLVFVREASALVRRGLWSITELESESLEFLRRFTISARSERGHHRDGTRISEMVSNWGGTLLERVERAFRESPLWQEYEEVLLMTAGATAVPCDPPEKATSETLTETTWHDIEITFLSDLRVQVKVGQQPVQTRNYAEMGFEDRRSGKPNQAWGLLRAIAQANGFIPNSVRDSKDFIGMEKRLERMRRTLKSHFQIGSDPLLKEPGKGYCCQFKIGCAPAFGT